MISVFRTSWVRLVKPVTGRRVFLTLPNLRWVRFVFGTHSASWVRFVDAAFGLSWVRFVDAAFGTSWVRFEETSTARGISRTLPNPHWVRLVNVHAFHAGPCPALGLSGCQGALRKLGARSSSYHHRISAPERPGIRPGEVPRSTRGFVLPGDIGTRINRRDAHDLPQASD